MLAKAGKLGIVGHFLYLRVEPRLPNKANMDRTRP